MGGGAQRRPVVPYNFLQRPCVLGRRAGRPGTLLVVAVAVAVGHVAAVCCLRLLLCVGGGGCLYLYIYMSM